MPPESSVKLNSLISILNQLDKGTRITATLLAESLGVTERTIYRYMMTLQNANYPIFFDRKKMSYRFVSGFSLKNAANQTEIFNVLDLKSRMLGSTSVGLVSYNAAGQCVIANNAAASMIGTSYEEVLSQNYMTLQSWKKSGLLIMAQDVMHSGRETAGEFHLFTTFDKEVWLHCSMSRFTQNGEHYLLLVVQDVTERKRMEQSIKDSEELLTLFVENSPIYTFIKDSDLKFVHVSSNYEQLLGKPIIEIVGKEMRELFPAEFAEKILLNDCAVLESDKKTEIDEEFDDKSFSTIKFPFKRGSKRFLAGYAIDITERKKYEFRLISSAKQFQAIVQTTLDAFWLIDCAGNFITVNDRACQMSGYSRDELLQMRVCDIEASENFEEFQKHAGKVIEFGSDRFETRHRMKDGSIIDVEVSTTHIQDSDNIIAFVREIPTRNTEKNLF
ncbi:MAG: PAS domain S-box protein [Desulfuromonadaceae bacterium]|nr:PAS domain S-box protein [Desulfuromonadaceae bacterium]